MTSRGPRPDLTKNRTVLFGKHQGIAYEDMIENYPDYCEWVMNTADIEDEANPELHHFASYLISKGFGNRKKPAVRQPAVYNMDAEPAHFPGTPPSDSAATLSSGWQDVQTGNDPDVA